MVRSAFRHIQTKTIIACFAILLGVAAVVGLSALPAAAADTVNTLKISPIRTDIELSPGEKRTVKITVTNLTESDITIRPVTNDFMAGDEDGTPALVLDENEYAPSHSLKRFMGSIEDITIPVGESRTAEVTITVPEDAQPGGYFGAVRFTPAVPADGGQVDLNASVASLILLTVPGDVEEHLELTTFEVQQKSFAGVYFGNTDNLEALFRFENHGNIQIGPVGKISVTRGDSIVYESDFNGKNPRDVLLPDSARKWKVPLENIDQFGRYTVSATFTYGKNNQTIEMSQSFWVIPLNYVIGGLVGLVLLIALIAYIVHRVRTRRGRMTRNMGRR